MIKKKIQSLFKYISYYIFFLINGKIHKTIKSKNNKKIKVKRVKFGNKLIYKVYCINSSRIYTDTINDTSIILDKALVDGPSFQLRNNKNSSIKNNSVLTKGTPRIKKKINGILLSLLTGGAGNNNYWHWMFDVLPRLAIANKIIKKKDIDFFLFPNTSYNFQRESLELLKIPQKKILSSQKYRHLEAKKILVTQHPYVFKNDPEKEIQKIPGWIIRWLRAAYLKKSRNKRYAEKIYIDRSDSKYKDSRWISNEKDLKNFLFEKGFSIVRLSEHHFNEQIKIFNNANYIVGSHGAGFANLVFCRPGTQVLELRFNNVDHIFKNLSKSVKLNYSSILGKTKKTVSNLEKDVEISLDELKKKIK